MGDESNPASEAAAPATECDDRGIVALISRAGQEPPADLAQRDALGAWAAASSVWHPSLINHVRKLPEIAAIEDLAEPKPGTVYVVADSAVERLPEGFRARAEELRVAVVAGCADRDELIGRVCAACGIDPPRPANPDLDRLAGDFLALGTARWWLGDLTIAMYHSDGLDAVSLAREVVGAAEAWKQGDFNATANRLRAAFELLTQARERFYPTDSYLVDVCLLDLATPFAALEPALQARNPISLLAPARAIEALANQDPERIARIRSAVADGWLDVVGGPFEEIDEALAPVESIVWQFRRGAEVYARRLDDRSVETLAGRRFALYPQRPQIARRFGFKFAWHISFEGGRFPVPSESKRLWSAPEYSQLEALIRPPIAADSDAEGPRLPWRIAKTMRFDHVATLALVHWPEPTAGWYRDLRTIITYSPVLGRSVTLGDYFHLSDRPYETLRPALDEYQSPALAAAVSRGQDSPIGRRSQHARLRSRVDGLIFAESINRVIERGASAAPRPEDGKNADPGTPDRPEYAHVDAPPHQPTRLAEPPADQVAPLAALAIEDLVEFDRLDDAIRALEDQELATAAALAQRVVGSASASAESTRRGFLVFNPLGVARRAPVLLPDADLDLRPEGALRASQFTDEGVWAVVDLPAFGFAWVPAQTNIERPAQTLGAVKASERTLRNESVAVEIDATTGGIRSLRRNDEETARLAQQIVIEGLKDANGAAAPSRMVCDKFDVEYGGPALAQAVSAGSILGPGNRALCRFRQRFRLWSGRPTFELEIALSDFDEDWLATLRDADPWVHFLSCRWAWPDANAMLRRTSLLAAEVTEADRPETPDALDISTRKQRTALLFGGLAHHRRHGPRMLDTLLLAGRETERVFRFGAILDREYPSNAALEFVSSPIVVPSSIALDQNRPSGWFLQLESSAVVVTRVEFVEPTSDSHGWGLVVHLLETSGNGVRTRLRFFREPTWARQIDHQNELVGDLSVDGDAVQLDLTPHELARVEVTLA